jgi:hypothetical protein
MADEILKRDQNRVPVLGAITNDSDQFLKMLRIDPVTGRLLVSAVIAGAPGNLSILDEGNLLTSTPTSMNFVGAGVTATVVGNDVTVTIPGSSSGVSSLNTLTGAVTLSAGAGIQLNPVGNDIEIESLIAGLIGSTSGITSTPTPGASTETWLGQGAGSNGASDDNTVFIGLNAGDLATGADHSIAIGTDALNQATNAAYAVAIGVQAGQNATDATGLIAIGGVAGLNALLADNAVFIGNSAGSGMPGGAKSVVIGYQAGVNATNSFDLVAIGQAAAAGATDAQYMVAIGNYAGNVATDAVYAVFIGQAAGYAADQANRSVFMGEAAGNTATNASNSFFLGANSGFQATNAQDTIAIGQSSAFQATDALQSVFLGAESGYSAQDANNSIFIGYRSGKNDTVDNSTAGFSSILIGDNTSTGGFENSIAIGNGATNTAVNQVLLASPTQPFTDIIFGVSGVNYHAQDIPLVAKVSIASASVLGLGTPLSVISAPGAGKYIQVLQVQAVIDGVTTPYATNLDLVLTYGSNVAADGAVIASDIGAGAGERSILESTVDSFSQFDLGGAQLNAAIATVVNAAVYLTAGTDMFGTLTPGNPTAGDGDVELIITYKVIEL